MIGFSLAHPRERKQPFSGFDIKHTTASVKARRCQLQTVAAERDVEHIATVVVAKLDARRKRLRLRTTESIK